jgi:plasmid maintenance system antidote protein VapI
MAMKNPPQSGDFIRKEIIQLRGLSVTAATAALKISRPPVQSPERQGCVLRQRVWPA